MLPTGLVYINVPGWTSYVRLLRGRKHMLDISHYNYFTPRTLTRLSHAAGLRVVETAPVTETGPAKSQLKRGLNRCGLGDCSVLLQRD